MSVEIVEPRLRGREVASWGAVYAMTLCVSALIASEFMPVSLLTPIAHDLGLTEGQAGQAISISGIFAVLTSLLISPATSRIDRRAVLLALTGVMIASGAVVAFAPNFAILMGGRALLGVAIGGFWSMSTATVMRLVPEDSVPRALAVLNGGNALATTIASPLGSFLGSLIGWRGAFFCVVPLAAIALAWQLQTLPAMTAKARAGAGQAFGVLLRPGVAWGMLAILLLFMGQFAVFTYVRPFLEIVTGLGIATLSLLLFVMGAAGLIGTYAVGAVARTRLRFLLVGSPLAMAAIAIGLVAFGAWSASVAMLLAGWGLVGTAIPVAWGTWLSRTLPEEAEAGGGLMVAVIQLAITAGATLGGHLVDTSGYGSAFLVGAALLFASSLTALRASVAK